MLLSLSSRKVFGAVFLTYIRNESESVFADLAIEEDLKKELKTTIELKLAPQAVKIRADFEITCFEYEGIDAIKEALVLGESMSNDEFEVSIKLVAPPMYVITTSAMEKEKGIDFINEVCTTISASIKQKNGNLSVKTEVWFFFVLSYFLRLELSRKKKRII